MPELDLQRVGLFLRDSEQAYPMQELSDFFGRLGIALVPLNEQSHGVRGLDLVIAMGGDGTVLRALDLFYRCPVLAINFGTVGFLTAGDRKDLESIIQQVLAGNFILSERLVLQCEHPRGSTRAVNEIIVGTSYHLIHVDVFVDDTKIRTIRGDGVVVGTPTGSTALLLSTGAPIVMPDVRCLILDGINEYNFTSRALILTPDSTIRLHVSEDTRDCEIRLMGDGRQVCNLLPGQDLSISRAPYSARLVYLDESYFFHNLSSKLGW